MDPLLETPSDVDVDSESRSSYSDDVSSCTADDIDEEDEDIDEDQLARRMMKMMKKHAGSVGKMLIERASLIDSICWLAQHVPRFVLDDLLEDTAIFESRDELEENLHLTADPFLSIADSSIVSDPSTGSASLPDSHRNNNSSRRNGVLSEDSGDIGDKEVTRVVTEERRKSYLDPFADDSDNDSVEKPHIPSFQDPFPYDSDDERERKKLKEHAAAHREKRGSPSSQACSATSSVRRSDDVRKHGDSKHLKRTSPMVLPYSSCHNCALLFVDISGFTKLSQILDVENLSKTINTYFDMIVAEVIRHGGDILKFAGDAIFAEWPVIDPSCGSHHSTALGRHRDKTCSLEDCAAVAALCAASIVNACNNFPIYVSSRGGSGEVGVQTKVGTLNVHCGLGVGRVAAVHVGDDELRREFLLVGDPIDQVSEAESAAALGEVAASPEALRFLVNVFDFDESVACYSEDRPVVIATRSKRHFRVKDVMQLAPLSNGATADMELKESLSTRCDAFDTDELKRLRQMISLYVHPVVVNDELGTEESLRVNNSAQDRHLAEAELRDVYTMFIMPLITAKLTGDERRDGELFVILNKILLIVNRELENHGGHLRQFIVDDKGVVLIANFGLRGSTFPNLISGHGLPCTTAIHNALQVELDVDNQIGGTFGTAYCGVVGGIRRHEFAVLGPSVNLSARLMCNSNNPGVLVDNRVRQKASKDFSFNALTPVKAKGYLDPVPIFQPLSAAEKRWGKENRDFVGRTGEIAAIVRIAKDVAYSVGESKMMYIQAESGTGKSSLVVQAISKVRKMEITSKKRVIITRNISNEGDRMVPFSMFRSVFKDVLKGIQGPRDDSQSGNSTHVSSSEDAGDGDSSSNLSGSVSPSISTAGMTSRRSSTPLDRFTYLVKELDAPPEFLEIVGHHILGIHDQSNGNMKKNAKAGSLETIVEFMARAFLRCTCHADLVVMALDDVHLLDELSWKVIQSLFKQGQNLLIICASRPLKSYKLEVDPTFWAELRDEYARELRFSELYLLGLGEDDIRNLISKRLGIRTAEIDNEFFADLHAKSGGMPHFASQMLETIKRNELVSTLENGKVGWRKDLGKEEMPDFNFATVGELIVYRIDSLDASVRKTLHLCAILGSEFELYDIIAVYQNWLQLDDSEKESRVTSVVKALDVAVEEGIIEEVYEGGQLEDSSQGLHQHQEAQDQLRLDVNISYRFHHAMWQENILKLMLDSRKRDLHRIIAESLESGVMGDEKNESNYYSMIKLFGHWKASGDTSKASSLALAIGKSFVEIGLNEEAVKIFDEALDMWRGGTDGDDIKESVAGFSPKVLEHISADDLKSVIQLHVDKGKCMSTLHRSKESVRAYNDALSIMQQSPASADLKDRSITFPLFSGLFVLLKFGKIEQDKECTYEQEIVRKFVSETKLHGDPVHYGRALGMQAEVLARLGKVAEALESFDLLSKIYNVEEHSAAVCKAYGSDRCAQVFSLSVLWYLQLGNEEKALELCEFSLKELLPKMDIKNVHNSMVFLWPIYSVLKERGQAKRMRTLLEDFVFKPFYEHYGEGGFTFCLPLYKPAGLLLELCENEGEIEDFDEKVEWVLQDSAGVFTDMFDNAMGNYGRTSTQVTAEVCLCLARRTIDAEKKLKLIAKGTALARMTSKLCRDEDGTSKMPFAFERNLPVLTELERMAAEFGVPEEMINNENFRSIM